MRLTFSEKLKELRKMRHLSQQKLADELKTSQSSIAAWELGTREPDFKTIEKIANYFNIPMQDLFPSETPDTRTEYMAITGIIDILYKRNKLYQLFTYSKYLSDSDIEVLITVAKALGEKGEIK